MSLDAAFSLTVFSKAGLLRNIWLVERLITGCLLFMAILFSFVLLNSSPDLGLPPLYITGILLWRVSDPNAGSEAENDDWRAWSSTPSERRQPYTANVFVLEVFRWKASLGISFITGMLPKRLTAPSERVCERRQENVALDNRSVSVPARLRARALKTFPDLLSLFSLPSLSLGLIKWPR